MSAADATPFPVYGQAYRFSGAIYDVTTGQVITGGLSSLAGTASADGAAFSGTGVTVTEIGTTGYFTVDLTAAVMTAYTVIVKVTEATANSADLSIVVNPVVLDEFTGRADAQSVKRLEQYVQQGLEYLTNLFTRNKNTGAMSLYQSDGATTIMTATDSDDGTTVSKGRLS